MMPNRVASVSDVRSLRAADVRPLRAAVLRPNQAPEASVYPLDDRADTLHVGAFESGLLVAVASVFHEARPGSGDPGAWRLRGVATLADARGRGHGTSVVRACEAHARERGGRRMWFNARTGAVGFYGRLGYCGTHEEPAGSGPAGHQLMQRELG